MKTHRSHSFASRISLASLLLLLVLVGTPVRADDRCLFPRNKQACLDLARTDPGVDCYWCSKGGVGMCVREGERAGAAQLQMACEGKAAAAAASPGNAAAVATKPAAGTSPTTTTTNANPRPTATTTTTTSTTTTTTATGNNKPNNLYTPAVQSFVQSNDKFTRTIASGGSVQVRACNNVNTHTCCIKPSQWTSNTCMATLGDDPCEELFGSGSRSCSVGKLSKCKDASCQLRCGASCGVFPFVERPGSSGAGSTPATTTASTTTTNSNNNNIGIQGPVATKTQNGVIVTVKKNP